MIAIVPDPYSQIGEVLTAQAAVRDDPLRLMQARKQIDTAQFNAGRLWQRYSEFVEVGGAKAVDTTKEPVDGGGMYDIGAESAKRERARKELKRADEKLGEYGCWLVSSVLGRRMSIIQCAAQRGYTTARGIDYLNRRFAECLEVLAKLWSLA